MPAWTFPGPLPADDVLAHAENSLLRYWSKADRPKEELRAMIDQIVVGAGGVSAHWLRMAYIEHAERGWLELHAKDHGVAKQTDETDSQLQQRLRIPTDVVTRPALLAGVQLILANAGVAGTATMIELSRDPEAAWIGSTTGLSIVSYIGLAPSGPMPTARIWHKNSFIVVLPAGTPASVVASVQDYLRSSKAGGIRHSVEVAV
jgi:hypothetical protein